MKEFLSETKITLSHGEEANRNIEKYPVERQGIFLVK